MRPKTHLYAALLLAGILVSCSTAQFKPRLIGDTNVYPTTTNQLLAEAKGQFRLGNVALAIDLFRKAARQSPGNTDALNGLAASYDRLGRFDLSRRYYEEALALAPEDPKIRHNFAVSLRMQGRQEELLAFEAELDSPENPPVQQGDPGAVPLTAPGVERSLAATAIAATTATAATTTALPAAVRTVQIVENPPTPVRQEGLERISMREVKLVTKSSNLPAKAAGVLVRYPAEVRVQAMPVSKAQKAAIAIPTEVLPLRVLNAVGRNGQAARMRRYLGDKGWDQIAVGNAARRRGASVIFYPAGAEASAAKLARQLPFKTPVVISENIKGVVLLLGLNAAPFDDRLRISTRKG